MSNGLAPATTLGELRRLLLSARRLPSSMTDVEAGLFLGFTAEEVGFLVARKLLIAQGNPPTQAPKYFSTLHLEERGNDPKWLDKARKSVRLHRKAKNDRDRAEREASVNSGKEKL
jgi:hypothetical protein